jgi:hypothetical protein
MRRLICGLVIAAALLTVSTPAFAGAQLVPSYFYPSGTPNPWNVMCDSMSSAGSASIAILNPASGPGRAADPNYAAALVLCQLDGQRVIGYVATKYTHKSIAYVEQAIDTYYSFYPTLDGIFLDNMSLSPDTKALCKGCTMTVESYYSELYEFVHANWSNATVVANPGTPATTSWQLSAPAADAVVTFEGSASSYKKYVPPSWVLAEPADKIANIIYAVPASALASECATATANNAGLPYVTDAKLHPNPYAALPSYWSTEISTC